MNHLIRNHEIPKRHAKKVLADWLNNHMLDREQVDANSKKFGLRVMNWPGIGN